MILTSQALASEVYNALVSINSLKDEEIFVSEERASDEITYSVRFPLKRGKSFILCTECGI